MTVLGRVNKHEKMVERSDKRVWRWGKEGRERKRDCEPGRERDAGERRGRGRRGGDGGAGEVSGSLGWWRWSRAWGALRLARIQWASPIFGALPRHALQNAPHGCWGASVLCITGKTRPGPAVGPHHRTGITGPAPPVWEGRGALRGTSFSIFSGPCFSPPLTGRRQNVCGPPRRPPPPGT